MLSSPSRYRESATIDMVDDPKTPGSLSILVFAARWHGAIRYGLIAPTVDGHRCSDLELPAPVGPMTS